MREWVCSVCGYVHRGEDLCEFCPVCAAPASAFDVVEESAAEKGVDEMSGKKIVIVGASSAGVAAATAVRQQSANVEVVLISAESDLPYYRLNLTRFLAGELSEDDLPIHPHSWYEEQHITLILGQSVQRLLIESKSIELQDKSRIEYDRLIMTAGAYPFIPPINGVEKSGVYSMRTFRDALTILEAVTKCQKIVCVGGGILGLEICAALARREASVTVLEASGQLMARQLNHAGSDVLEQQLNRLGVKVLKDAVSESIEGDEYVSGVRLKDGRLVEADMVVIAVGVRSNTWMLEEAGLGVERGVVVDSYLQTSGRGIYAAGDIAESEGKQYGSWAAAQYQGNCAGLNAIGKETVCGDFPRAHSLKVVGKDLFSIGVIVPEGESDRVFEAYSAEGYRMFMIRGGVLVGAILMGDIELVGAVRNAVERGRIIKHLSIEGILSALLGE